MVKLMAKLMVQLMVVSLGLTRATGWSFCFGCVERVEVCVAMAGGRRSPAVATLAGGPSNPWIVINLLIIVQALPFRKVDRCPTVVGC